MAILRTFYMSMVAGQLGEDPPLNLKQKKTLRQRRSVIQKRQLLTLPPTRAVPSAQLGLTSLFGMVRGETQRYSHLKLFSGAFPVFPLTY